MEARPAASTGRRRATRRGDRPGSKSSGAARPSSEGDSRAAYTSSREAREVRERIEGRKLSQTSELFGKFHEVRYRVDEFVAFYKGRGTTGGGLVQFKGVKARRSYLPGEPKPKWSTEMEVRKHTVELTPTTKISDLK